MKINNLSTTVITPVDIDPYYYKTNRYPSMEYYTPCRNNFDYHHKEAYKYRSLDPNISASQAENRADKQFNDIFGVYG